MTERRVSRRRLLEQIVATMTRQQEAINAQQRVIMALRRSVAELHKANGSPPADAPTLMPGTDLSAWAELYERTTGVPPTEVRTAEGRWSWPDLHRLPDRDEP